LAWAAVSRPCRARRVATALLLCRGFFAAFTSPRQTVHTVPTFRRTVFLKPVSRRATDCGPRRKPWDKRLEKEQAPAGAAERFAARKADICRPQTRAEAALPGLAPQATYFRPYRAQDGTTLRRYPTAVAVGHILPALTGLTRPKPVATAPLLCRVFSCSLHEPTADSSCRGYLSADSFLEARQPTGDRVWPTA
jgi:hypothetical protein